MKPNADPRIGSNIGKYRVLSVLGQGGMGVVYEAEDPVLERKVALKLLTAEVSDDAEARARFLAEGKAAARVLHPNAVAVFDVGDHGGLLYMAMELVRGGSASDFVKKRGAFNWPEATRVIADAARGLDAAHRAGLIHRDIKPANIMRAADGTVKVADFGLAKATDAVGKDLTQTGVVVGTPYYMSPEQCKAEGLDARSDIYSLGAAYYCMLTGNPPYTAGGNQQVMFAHCHKDIPDPRDAKPEIPAACAEIVRRAMAKEPADRYQTAAQMAAELDAAISGSSAAAAEPDNAWAELARAASAAKAKPTGGVPLSATQTRSLKPVRSGAPARPAWVPLAAAGAGLAVAVVAAVIIFRGAADKPKPPADGAVAKGKAADPAPEPPPPDPPIEIKTPVELPVEKTPVESKSPLTKTPNETKVPVTKTPVETKVLVETKRIDPPIGAADWDALRPGELPADFIKALGAAAAPKELVAVLDGTRNARSLAFSRDGSLLAVGIERGEVQAWSCEAGLRRRVVFHGGNHRTVLGMSFAFDGKTLVGCADTWVKVWELFSANPRDSRQPIATRPAPTGVALSPDGRTLAAATAKGPLLARLEASGFGPWQTLGNATTTGVAFAADGRVLAAFGPDGVDLWQLGDGAGAPPPPDRIAPGAACGDISPDGSVIAFGLADGTIRIHRGSGDKAVESAPIRAHEGAVACISVSPDGKLVASAGKAGGVTVWNAADGTKRLEWNLPAGANSAGYVAFAPNGRHVAALGPDGFVCILRIAPK